MVSNFKVCMHAYRIAQLCGGGNIGEFGKSTAIRQYFTYQYFLTNLVSLLLNPNSPNFSPPISGDKPIRQFFPRCIIALYGITEIGIVCLLCTYVIVSVSVYNFWLVLNHTCNPMWIFLCTYYTHMHFQNIFLTFPTLSAVNST